MLPPGIYGVRHRTNATAAVKPEMLRIRIDVRAALRVLQGRTPSMNCYGAATLRTLTETAASIRCRTLSCRSCVDAGLALRFQTSRVVRLQISSCTS